MSMIQVDHLSKTYASRMGKMPALSECCMAAGEGEAVALLGCNGAGKSTLIRILATLLRPDSGRASIAGFDVGREARQVRAHIGVALQETCVCPSGTVLQILIHHARLLGFGRKAASQRCDEVIEVSGLARASNRRVGQLSGGTRRRVDLALAVIHSPPVLLLDEPTDSFDLMSGREFRRELRRMCDRGTCVLFASQSREEVKQLADRVIFLKNGSVWRGDSPVAALRDVWPTGAVDVA